MPSRKTTKTLQKSTKKNIHNRKANIPKAIREQVWLKYFGKKYERTCFISWCANTVSVFDFHVGHDQPECKGGTLSLHNLKPICARCNLSMGSTYTIKEWDRLNDSHYDAVQPLRHCCSFFICGYGSNKQ